MNNGCRRSERYVSDKKIPESSVIETKFGERSFLSKQLAHAACMANKTKNRRWSQLARGNIQRQEKSFANVSENVQPDNGHGNLIIAAYSRASGRNY